MLFLAMGSKEIVVGMFAGGEVGRDRSWEGLCPGKGVCYPITRA